MNEEKQMVPSKGRIVHYTLTETDAERITRRRTDGASIAERMGGGTWPAGAQAHIGNPVGAGDVFPMLIVRVWGSDASAAVNGKVELDGTDCLWVTSVVQGHEPGQWFEPPRV